MADRIRLGFIGANVRATWAAQSHFPALLASPDVELTAVCTTRRETAEAAREAFGAKLAFTDFREMVVSKEIDAVAVVVRVPAHYEPTRAAIEAGKHVYTEWPLGRTTANGHVIDALRFVAGNYTRVSAMLTTQARQWYETDTRKMVDVTAPDNILVSGKLASGAVASVHVAAVPWAGGGLRMVIYGREGTLMATGNVSSQRGEMLRVQGAKRSHELSDMPIPDRFVWLPPEFPRGDPFNVGQMYRLFAEAIRTGQTQSRLPTFDTAVDLHRFLDTIRQSSDTGRELPVA